MTELNKLGVAGLLHYVQKSTLCTEGLFFSI